MVRARKGGRCEKLKRDACLMGVSVGGHDTLIRGALAEELCNTTGTVFALYNAIRYVSIIIYI